MYFYLLASIFCSVLIGFIFKLFPKYGINTLQAIVVNYFVCVACAVVHMGRFPIQAADFYKPWMPYALGLGFVFITGFNAAAATVHHFSVTVSQIMQKMSILATVPFAIWAYQESAGAAKIVGWLFALAAIILVNLKTRSEKKAQKEAKRDATQAAPTPWWLLGLPFVTWLLASVIEIVFVRVEGENMIEFGDVSFISTVFGTAGIIGSCVVLYLFFSGKTKLDRRNALAGLILGIPNYGSMVFILLALGSGMEGSLFFPINNVGIILLTAFGALLLFQERFSKLNWIGIGCAVVAILLLGL